MGLTVRGPLLTGFPRTSLPPAGGQKAFPETVMRYLREMEWGRGGFATRWWPGWAPGIGFPSLESSEGED